MAHSSPRRPASIPVAAQYATVSERTIRRWFHTGRLRAYRVGPRQIRIDLDDLDALIQPVSQGIA